jgi:hypothetical protein
MQKLKVKDYLPEYPKIKPFEKFLFDKGVRKNSQGLWECYQCRGRGTLICPEEFCDPIDGYKDAKRYTCDTCLGARYGKYRTYYLEEYKHYKCEIYIKRHLWNLNKKIIQDIINNKEYPYLAKELFLKKIK